MKVVRCLPLVSRTNMEYRSDGGSLRVDQAQIKALVREIRQPKAVCWSRITRWELLPRPTRLCRLAINHIKSSNGMKSASRHISSDFAARFPRGLLWECY